MEVDNRSERRHRHETSRNDKANAHTLHDREHRRPQKLLAHRDPSWHDHGKEQNTSNLQRIAQQNTDVDGFVRIQAWLAQMESELLVPPAITQHHPKNGPITKDQGEDQDAQQDVPDRLWNLDTAKSFIRRRRRQASSDSSLIDSPLCRVSCRCDQEKAGHDSSPKSRLEEMQHHNHGRDASYTTLPKIPNADNNENLKISSRPVKTYEKRPRRKTRDDRYETKKLRRDKDKDIPLREEQTRRPSRPKTKKKPTSRNEKDVLHKLESDNVGDERVTLRPNTRPGLFLNGRASSPLRRRGVSDLTFSEIDFLHYARQPLVEKLPGRIRETIREKQKRKISQMQEEVSTYFQAKRKPLTVIEANLRPQTPINGVPKVIYCWSLNEESHRLSNTYDQECRKSMHMVTPNAAQENANTRQAFHQRNTKRGWVAHTSSTISWSETQLYSTNANGAREQWSAEEVRNYSETPESIRRIIQDTGIFRNTSLEEKHPLVRASSPIDARDYPGGNVSDHIRDVLQGEAATSSPSAMHARPSLSHYTRQCSVAANSASIQIPKSLPVGEGRMETSQNVLDSEKGSGDNPHNAALTINQLNPSEIPLSGTYLHPCRTYTLSHTDRVRIAKRIRIKGPSTKKSTKYMKQPKPPHSTEITAGILQKSNEAPKKGSGLEGSEISCARSARTDVDGQHISNSENQAAFQRDKPVDSVVHEVVPTISVYSPDSHLCKTMDMAVEDLQTIEGTVSSDIRFAKFQDPYSLGLPVRGGPTKWPVDIRPIFVPFHSYPLSSHHFYSQPTSSTAVQDHNGPSEEQHLVNEQEFLHEQAQGSLKYHDSLDLAADNGMYFDAQLYGDFTTNHESRNYVMQDDDSRGHAWTGDQLFHGEGSGIYNSLQEDFVDHTDMGHEDYYIYEDPVAELTHVRHEPMPRTYCDV